MSVNISPFLILTGLLDIIGVQNQLSMIFGTAFIHHLTHTSLQSLISYYTSKPNQKCYKNIILKVLSSPRPRILYLKLTFPYPKSRFLFMQYFAFIKSDTLQKVYFYQAVKEIYSLRAIYPTKICNKFAPYMQQKVQIWH